MRLKIQIPERWATEDEPISVRRGQNEIQVFFDDISESTPLPGPEELEDTAAGFGVEHLYGDVVESFSETCSFGKMGTAVFRSLECPRIQVWLLSNDKKLIWVIHVCRKAADDRELSEARELVQTLGLSD
jgi:hypothetical protein